MTDGSRFQLDHKDLEPRHQRKFEHPDITDNRTLREALEDGEKQPKEGT